MTIYLNTGKEITWEEFCNYVLNVIRDMWDSAIPPYSKNQINKKLREQKIFSYERGDLERALEKLINDGSICREIKKGVMLYSFNLSSR